MCSGLEVIRILRSAGPVGRQLSRIFAMSACFASPRSGEGQLSSCSNLAPRLETLLALVAGVSGQHQCIPTALEELGIPFRAVDFVAGPYTYGYVLSVVPGLRLVPVAVPEEGCSYLFHQHREPLSHCAALSVQEGVVHFLPPSIRSR